MKTKKHISKGRFQTHQEYTAIAAVDQGRPEFLYHGSDEATVIKILNDGLLPRMERQGNWKEFPSNPKCVYLTNCYAPYFALVGALENGGRMGIIEIQTSDEMLNNCVPDEDYLEHSTRYGYPYGTEETQQRTKLCQSQMMDLKGQWNQSLSGLGTLCHVGQIAPNLITRVAFIDAQEWRWMLTYSWGMDFRVALSQHTKHFLKQRALTQWILGEYVPLREILGEHRPTNAERRQFSEKRGVEVFSNKCDLPYAA